MNEDTREQVESNMAENTANFRGATIEKVMRIEVNEGEGTEESPLARVIYWLDMNGNLIGRNDPREG